MCVSPDALPWCYRNSKGDLVGFEVNLAHVVAVELNTRLSLVPVERTARGDALARGACDISTGRIIPSEASVLAFSRPVAREEWAFLVPDYAREVYASLGSPSARARPADRRVRGH